MATRDGPADVDWSVSSTPRVDARAALLLAGLASLGGLFAYDYLLLGAEPVVLGYDVGRLEWLWVASLWLAAVSVGWPALRNRDRTAEFLRGLGDRPATLLAGLFLAVVFLAGTVGPVVLSQPTPSFEHSNQPPVFASIGTEHVGNCLNQVGDRCVGTWRYPLGTTASGTGILALLAFGARNVVMLSVVSITFIAPVATVVGTVSAYLGGGVDRLLTGMAEALKLIPGLLVFLVWRWLTGDGSLFALVVAFGLANWGNVAIIVRSRTLNEVGKNYVRSAEAAGAGTADVVRRHLVPNVARTAVSAAVYQVPLFITIEATLSFLKFGDPASFLLTTPPSMESWGRLIGRSINGFQPYWWRVAVPVAALFLTILATNVLADGLQALFDPRSNE